MQPKVLDPEKEVAVYKPSALAKISQGFTEESVKILAEECKALEIKSVDDKEGYKLVYEKHQIIKKHISGIDKDFKAGKERITEASKMFNAEKNKWTNLLKPISEDLKAKREIVEKEKERLAEIENQRIKELGEKRGVELMASGAEFDGLIYHCGEEDEAKVKSKNLALLEDNVYSDLLEMAKIQAENKQLEKEALEKKQKEEKAEAERIRKEEADKQAKISEENRKKQEELDKRQAEQDAKDEAQRIAQKKIDDENAAIERKKEEEKRAKQQAIEVEEAKKKAAEDAKKQAEIDAKKKEDDRIESERLEKERKAEEERQKPDKDKLLWFLSELKTIELPDVKTKKSINIKCALKREIELLVEKYQDKIK